MRSLRNILLLSLLVSACMTSCVSMVNNTFESSRTLGKGRMDVTADFGRTISHVDGGKLQNMGLRVGYGLKPKTDLRLRYELLNLNRDIANPWGHFVEASAKLGLIQEIAVIPFASFYLSPNRMFRDSNLGVSTNAYLSTGTSILFSTRISTYLEPAVNLKLGAYFPVNNPYFEPAYPLAAVDVSLGISPRPDVWSVRPGVGLYFNEFNLFSRFLCFTAGVGVNYYFEPKKLFKGNC
ncbi:MAG: hypothetical protein H6581_24215 [Bacteroidia bacterium]|nr:hypothetical protein [Bacteroidia bacterium]